MYKEQLKMIIDASQNNALTFFVGAGVSTISGTPTWKDLINAICDEMGYAKKEYYSSDEYLQIPQMFYYSLDKSTENYNRFIKKQLSLSEHKPNCIHREMLCLNPVSFITTNYDTLLENAAIDQCQSYKVVSCDNDVPSIFGDRFILKIHGDFRHNNFVLKEEDYLNYSESFKLIETLAKSIFSTNTVVFIGYSLNDYNIKLILNWTKSLLKDSFRKPIFIYADPDALSKEKLVYLESKGLSVVECNKLISCERDDFLSRYQSVFSAIKSLSDVSLNGKTENDAFDILYELLKPLDRLNALRISDVSDKLSPYVSINNDGVIVCHKEESLILKKLMYINGLNVSEQSELSDDLLNKYHIIMSVFQKARIWGIRQDVIYKHVVKTDVPFADDNCIRFNYRAMQDYVSKSYSSYTQNYKKAFYLSRLRKYDEAFLLFSEVARQSFENEDYLLYYLAKTNCIWLGKVIKNADRYGYVYDPAAVESVSFSEAETETLFYRLPVEFRNAYNSIKNLHSSDMLYKYAYSAVTDSQQLQKTIETETIEFGLTSSDKVICRINEYLHFILGNGLVSDIFSEYKNTVKNLMIVLLYKYSTQEAVVLREPAFPFENKSAISFDIVDFYCFIECFDDKELKAQFNKYNVETIVFQNTDDIEQATSNLLDYYDYLVKKSEKTRIINAVQKLIKSCLVLLQYIDISQNLVDKVCYFILSQEFHDIRINDKIVFLHYQLKKRKKTSKTTAQIVEDTLLSYIDLQINALESHTAFDLPSTNHINYYNLVNYIYPHDESFVSRRLTRRVNRILGGELTQMYSHIMEHYCFYVSENQKNRIISWAKKKLSTSFDFKLFKMVVALEAPIDEKMKTQLKMHLMECVNKQQSDTASSIIHTYPAVMPYEELNYIGYLCLIEVLNTEEYTEFLGISDEFDFYCKYDEFDYNRFNVSWLVKFTDHALARISNNKIVNERVRIAIAKTILENRIADNDLKRLQTILVKYFC